MDRNRYRGLIKQVAYELGIDPNASIMAYDAMWLFIKKKIAELDLELPVEELVNFQTSFNIPKLGKFYIDFKKFKERKEWIKIRLQEKNM